MKKISIVFLFSLLSFSAFCADIALPKQGFRNFKKGDPVQSFGEGYVIYAEEKAAKVKKSSQDIPDELANGVVIVSYEDFYYDHGQKKTITNQIINSNIKPDKSIKKATEKKPIKVNSETVLGTATGELTLIVRNKELDPYLAFCAANVPVLSGSYWYFDMESLMPGGNKYLKFQPIESKDTLISFDDGISNSLEEIITSSGCKRRTPC